MSTNLVDVKNLSVSFSFNGKMFRVVNDVSFSVKQNEILGIVGESGSGKSVTAKSLIKLIQFPGKIETGEILFNDQDILKLTTQEIVKIRGRQIAMIFQEPMSSLNPVYTCGDQITEAIVLHQKVSSKEAFKRAAELLTLVGISLPEVRLRNYPHELSGGMRQRIMIAMALSCNPRLLIADEPTTALDSTIQAQIIELIKELRHKMSMSIVYITHDLGVVAETCERVIVMYAGRIMEAAPVYDVFYNTSHPYTKGLMRAIPKVDSNVGKLYAIEGMVPYFNEMPIGCPYNPRCPFCTDRCVKSIPALVEVGPEHFSRCFRAKEMKELEI
jgi:oligopeptide/dipeptide ABC transporter ATP-binding protein